MQPQPPPSTSFDSSNSSSLPKFASSFQPKFQFTDPISNALPTPQTKNPFSIAAPASTTFSFSLPTRPVTSITTGNVFFKNPTTSDKKSSEKLSFGTSSQGAKLFAAQPLFTAAQSKISLPQFGMPEAVAPSHSARPSSSFSFVSSLENIKAAKTIPAEKEASSESSDLKKENDNNPDLNNPVNEGNNQRRSSDIIPQLSSIVCKSLPLALNNKELLLEHFSQFGKVERVSCSRRNKQAIIQFDSHRSADAAKKHGSQISPHHNPVLIFWCQSTRKSKEHKRSKHALPAEVDSELQAMLEGAEDHAILPRPEDELHAHHIPKRISKSKKIPSEKHSSRSKRTNTEHPVLKSLQQAAHTSEDRYAILDSRDKLLRLNLKKQSDLASAKCLFGTCSDMCPERERYARFTKKCLSIFEQKVSDSRLSMELSSLDHRLIIKEYSRSSADQEEPLSHELRPTSSLQITMDYLLCNIINKGDSISTGEWYDFIWNRTRAIRKDITQQHLCNISCVEIVEKCARFHIHCAATLCDEDMSVFDPKINDENLTKCLQTLKHLYQDLTEKNIQCLNEPEFRAYDILLSLKEGDTLRHVQKLHIDVRNTSRVQFAVQAALAFSSNNYIRFFKLVEQATYLNACVLHRYFNHVRMQAIQVILKAFCAPNRTEQYPVEDMCNMLKFDDMHEANEFFKLLGFRIEDEAICLDRLAFVMPISPLVPSRSAIVDKKKVLSLGEVINMGPLPDNPLNTYVPHDSFDSGGFLKQEAYQALDQAQNKDVPPEEPLEVIVPLKSPKKTVPVPYPMPFVVKDNVEQTKKPSFFVPRIEETSMSSQETQVFPLVKPTGQTTIPVKGHFYDVAKQSQDSHAKESLEVAEIDFKASLLIKKMKQREEREKKTEAACQNIIEDVLRNQMCSISREVYSAEYERIKQEKDRIALYTRKESAKSSIAESILTDVISSCIKSFIEKEISAIRSTRLGNFCAGFCKKLFEECIEQNLVAISKKVYDEERKLWKTELDSIKKRLAIYRIRKALTLWRKASMKRRNLEACRNLFPSCPPLANKTKPSTSLANPAHCLLDQARANHILDASLLFETIKDEIGWYPYDLRPSFEKSISLKVEFPKLAPKIYFWKLLLVHEEKSQDKAYAMFTKWLCAKFTKGFVKQDVRHNTCITSLYWLTNAAGDYIAVCIRSISISQQFPQTLEHLKRNFLLDGACGIFVCIPYSQNPQETSNFLLNVTNLIKVKFLIPSISMHCFIIGKEPIQVSSWLKQLKEQQLLQEYLVSEVDFSEHSFSLSEMVFNAFEWLLHRCPAFPEVTTENISDFVQNGVVVAFNTIYNDLSHCLKKGIHQNPQCIVMFINEVIALRSEVTISEMLKSISWPVPEVVDATGIGKYDVLEKIREEPRSLQEMLKQISLPPFVQNPNSIESVGLYVGTVVSKFKKDPSVLLSSIRHFLGKKCQIGNNSIPWADIIHECIQYAATCQEFPFADKGKPLKILYIRHELDELDLENLWQQIKLEYPPLENKKESSLFSIETVSGGTHKEEISKTAKRKREDPKELVLDGKECIVVDPHLQHLQKKLLLEKQESDAFLAQLQQSASYDLSPKSMKLSQHYSTFQSESTLLDEAPEKTELSTFDLFTKISELRNNLENERRASDAFSSSLMGLLL